jgi:hypothetical protein
MAAGVAGAMAQNVYSVNVVGYVNVPIFGNGTANHGTGLYTLIANPLDASNGGANPGGNTLSNLFQTPNNFDEFLQWNGTNAFNISTYEFGSWTANYTVAPGTGGFYQTTSPYTNTFAGTVLQGSLTNSIKSGFQVVGNQVPVTADVVSNGLSANLNNFDEVLVWNEADNSGNGGFDIYTYEFGGWSPSTPVMSPGQAVFTDTASGDVWVQTFTVQ